MIALLAPTQDALSFFTKLLDGLQPLVAAGILLALIVGVLLAVLMARGNSPPVSTDGYDCEPHPAALGNSNGQGSVYRRGGGRLVRTP